MLHRVMIMEIKAQYAIGFLETGEMVRIKKKEGLSVGEKVYVLDDDFIEEKKEYLFLLNTASKRMVATLAVIFICCMCIYQLKPIQAYAMVSLDGESSLQLKLDKDGNIIEATSIDNSYSKLDLAKMKGKSLDELEFEGVKVVGIASLTHSLDDEYQEEIKSIFNEDVIFVVGDKNDVDDADDKNTSLGMHLVEQDELDEVKEEVKENFEEKLNETNQTDFVEQEDEVKVDSTLDENVNNVSKEDEGNIEADEEEKEKVSNEEELEGLEEENELEEDI